MIDVLKFIFSDFWIWLGTVVLVGVFGSAVASVLLAVRGNREAKP